MKKTLLACLCALLSLNLAFGAPAKTTKTNKNLGKFTKGSVVDGTPATGKVRRWYFFNEGSAGSSYTFLGKSQYLSVDLGYSLYLRSIESMLGGMNFMFGTEISVPMYLKVMPNSKSNILSDHRYLERQETEGLAGFGVELPLMIGLEYKGFYIAGLAGYTWLFMKDTYKSANAGAYPTIQTQYDGIVYGGGIGYKISNIVNFGIRYTGGSLTNREGARTSISPEANRDNLGGMVITNQTGRPIYNIPYHRIHAFISIIF
ncbi:hypothetical protein LW135_06875 [Helicobacter sp. faydin-H20]|uniref:hypothetical protein n=1 Tax=Helicobacter anatolicus TaxID=2905874 RepID=UPI001E4CDEB9|nr:hypothetical protein [Helicobacter anatolicus]MCE3037543.1 hypothetical protein [Helicobacter anatolicus]